MTGARQYDVPTDGYGLRGESQYGQVDWLGSLGEVAYLARSKVRHVRAPDGTWLGSEAVTRPTVRAMDTRTGKSLLTFEPLLDSHRSLIGDVTRGMCVTRGREIGVSAFCRRGQVAAFFHPKSGARQGEIARVRDVARRGSEPDAGVSDDVQFVLLDTTPPRLRAVNVSSGHVVWTSKGLLGAVAVAAVGTSLVVVDATTRALVVHRGTGSVVATLPQPETNHRYLAMRAWIQSRHIITWTPLQDVNYVAAWDRKMYRRVWHVDDADVQFVSNAHVALVANNFANGHRPPIADAETWQSRGPTLTMHDLQSGAQMWTWQPPLPSTEVVTSVRMEARQIGARVAVRMVWIGR